eukprot:403338859
MGVSQSLQFSKNGLSDTKNSPNIHIRNKSKGESILQRSKDRRINHQRQLSDLLNKSLGQSQNSHKTQNTFSLSLSQSAKESQQIYEYPLERNYQQQNADIDDYDNGILNIDLKSNKHCQLRITHQNNSNDTQNVQFQANSMIEQVIPQESDQDGSSYDIQSSDYNSNISSIASIKEEQKIEKNYLDLPLQLRVDNCSDNSSQNTDYYNKLLQQQSQFTLGYKISTQDNSQKLSQQFEQNLIDIQQDDQVQVRDFKLMIEDIDAFKHSDSDKKRRSELIKLQLGLQGSNLSSNHFRENVMYQYQNYDDQESELILFHGWSLSPRSIGKKRPSNPSNTVRFDQIMNDSQGEIISYITDNVNEESARNNMGLSQLFPSKLDTSILNDKWKFETTNQNAGCRLSLQLGHLNKLEQIHPKQVYLIDQTPQSLFITDTNDLQTSNNVNSVQAEDLISSINVQESTTNMDSCNNNGQLLMVGQDNHRRVNSIQKQIEFSMFKKRQMQGGDRIVSMSATKKQ